MEVNWDAAKFWLDFIVWLVAMVVAISAWVRAGSNKNKGTIEVLDKRQYELEKRVLSAEKQLENAPTHDDISEVREEISGIKANLQQNTYMLQRVHDYLMNNKV